MSGADYFALPPRLVGQTVIHRVGSRVEDWWTGRPGTHHSACGYWVGDPATEYPPLPLCKVCFPPPDAAAGEPDE